MPIKEISEAQKKYWETAPLYEVLKDMNNSFFTLESITKIGIVIICENIINDTQKLSDALNKEAIKQEAIQILEIINKRK